MNKFLLSAAISAVAIVAQADYLLWSIDVEKIQDYEQAAGVDVDKVRVGYVSSSSSSLSEAGTPMSIWSYGGTELGTGGIEDWYNVDCTEDAYKVDVTGLSSETYGYYIELLSSDNKVLGRTTVNKKFETYAQLNGKYIATGSVEGEPTTPPEIWLGGEFAAVPEPSSMALLALGAGLVGLRRKLKKNKKEIRA